MTSNPILQFWTTCRASGVHTLSFLAVLCQIESGASCRQVATTLGIAGSTVWRAAKALQDQDLIGIEEIPHPGGAGIRFRLTVTTKGQNLLDQLTLILTQPTPTT